MPNPVPSSTLEKFTTFGDLLRFLRRRAGITQLELSIAVGYSDSQISRLEQNMRLPDIPTIEALFVPALCLEDEPHAVARLLELAAAVRREDAPSLGLCPYKGLDFFDEADADLFVGREALTAELVDRILALSSQKPVSQLRFFAIVGASGSGKSSLVRAGLVPALRWNKSCANWLIQVITPTAHPVENLACALPGDHASLASTAALMDDMMRDPRSFSLFLKRQLKTRSGSFFLLVIDQFEELFTLCHSEEERSAFIANLLTAVNEDAGSAIVIITLRADFYAYCAGYLQLRQALSCNQEYIGAMDRGEMLRAIEEPAQRGRWEFEPGLVDLILQDVGSEPGALPLLSHALFETWLRRHGRTMTLSGYTSAGGVRGAIAETAEAVFTDQFTRQQQVIARRIFIRLTELGDHTATGDTRRRAAFNELILRPEESDATHAVINALADARLVTTSEDSVQVAHEALIREWPTLRAWLEENREGLRLHRQLTDSSHDWIVSNREPDLLFRGARLAQAREWSAEHGEDLNIQEKEFLAASIEASESELAEREARYRRELEAAQKLADIERQRAEDGIRSAQRLKRRSILSTGLITLAVLLIVFAAYVWRQSTSRAALNHSLNLADAALQANQSGRGDLALALAMKSVELKQPPLQSISALRNIALGPGRRALIQVSSQAVNALALSPDGTTAAYGICAKLNDQGACLEGELVLWDLGTQKELLSWPGNASRITALTFSSDGQVIISGGEDGSMLEWSLDGKLILQLPGHTNRITGLSVVPSFGALLSGSEDGSLLLSNLQSGEILNQFWMENNPITAFAVASYEPVAVTAHQNGTLMVWNLFKTEPIGIFPGQGSEIRSIAISTDGSWILLTSQARSDMFLRKVDTRTGNLINQETFGCTPGPLALSQDASFALVACQTMIFQLNIPNWILQQSFCDSADIVNALVITHDGRLAVSASEDGSLQVVNLQSINLGDLSDFHEEIITPDNLDITDISSDGKNILISGASDYGFDRLALWSVSEHKLVKTFLGFNGNITPGAVAISPNTEFVAAAGYLDSSRSSVVMEWDFKKETVQCKFESYPMLGMALAFTPDSRYLLGSFQDQAGKSGQIILWDARTCELVQKFDTSEAVGSITFSTDGKRAVTGSGYQGRVILWDVNTGKEIRRYRYAQSGPVKAVVFGPADKSILAAGSSDLYLWDAESGNLIRRYSGHTSFPWSLAVSPDGRYVFSSSQDGEVIMLNFVTGEELYRKDLPEPVSSVAFNMSSTTVYAATLDGKLLEWQINEKSLPELLDWINANRYVRDLTCEERAQYQVEPQCKQ